MKDLTNISAEEAKSMFDCSTVEGTQAWSKWYEAKKARLYTRVEPNSNKYFVSTQDENNIFNVFSILNVLALHEPEEVLRHIERGIRDLTLHYTDGEGKGIVNAGYTLMVLQDVRNALMAGMGYFVFDEHLTEESLK